MWCCLRTYFIFTFSSIIFISLCYCSTSVLHICDSDCVPSILRPCKLQSTARQSREIFSTDEMKNDSLELAFQLTLMRRMLIELVNTIVYTHTRTHIIYESINANIFIYLFVAGEFRTYLLYPLSTIIIIALNSNQLVQEQELRVLKLMFFFHSNLIVIESRPIFHLANCVFPLIFDTAAAVGSLFAWMCFLVMI